MRPMFIQIRSPIIAIQTKALTTRWQRCFHYPANEGVSIRASMLKEMWTEAPY